MRYLIPILLFFILLSPATAQEESPFPILYAEDIFAEGVTVLERLPAIQIDNKHRFLYYFSPQENRWKEYAYPPELTSIESITERSDRSYFLNSRHIFDLRLNPESAWLFDSSKGIIQPSVVCNLIQALPNEGEWRLTRLDDEDVYRFCNTETGIYTAPIPQNLVQSTEAINPDFDANKGILSCNPGMPDSLPVASPDNHWILFESCTELQSLMHTLYVYDTYTNNIIELGNGDLADYAIVRGWLDNQRPIIQLGDYRTGASHRIYTAILSESKSLQFILGSYAWWPYLMLNDDAPKVIAVQGMTGEVIEADLLTGTTNKIAQYTDSTGHWEAGFVLYRDTEIIAIQSGYPLDAQFPIYLFDSRTGEVLYENPRTTWVDFTINYHFLVCDWDIESGTIALNIIRILDSNPAEVTVLTEDNRPCPFENPLISLNLPFSYNEFAILANQGQYFIYSSHDMSIQTLTVDSDYQTELLWHDEQSLEVIVCASRNANDCSGYEPLARWLISHNSIIRGEQ